MLPQLLAISAGAKSYTGIALALCIRMHGRRIGGGSTCRGPKQIEGFGGHGVLPRPISLSSRILPPRPLTPRIAKSEHSRLYGIATRNRSRRLGICASSRVARGTALKRRLVGRPYRTMVYEEARRSGVR